MRWSCLSVLFLCWSGPVMSARILALLPFLGKSHFVMFDPLLDELSARGHSLLVLTPFPREPPLPPGYREISLKGRVPYLNNQMTITSYEGSKVWGYFFDLIGLHWLLTTNYEVIFEVEGVKELLKGEEEFDLALVELFNTDMFLGVAHKLGLPVIALSSGTPMPWALGRFACPDSPVYSEGPFTSSQGLQSFSARLSNALALWISKTAYALFFEPYSQRLAEKYLGPLPPLGEIAKNTSLFLVNSHFSLHKPRPLTPAIIEVGGLHVKPPKKLPLELDKFLNNSENGVIYFSMGSVLRGESWSAEKREIFIQAFAKLKQNVLWKWEGDDIPDKPKNVFTNPWIPQRDLLAHPKVLLFITHGGVFGITEAVHSGVPMIGIPVFGDQEVNVEAVRKAGSTLSLDFNTLQEPELSSAIQEILTNPMYKKNAERLCTVFQDRPSTAMDIATFWIEYVIRHKGASQLKMEAVDLAWYQYYLIDIYGFLLIVVFISLYILYFVARKFFRLCCKPKIKVEKKKLKKK